MVFVFADCELDGERRELRRHGAAVHIEPQVFDVLHHLVTHRDRVVTKDELFQAVWSGRIVSEATLTSRISAARRAIGDAGDRQSILRTFARRGYSFCGAVEERSIPARPRSETASRDGAPSNLPVPATSLFGREAAAAEIVARLADTRMLTLTGVGGVGKTRLALDVAQRARGAHPDGVWLTELAALSDPGAVCHAVAGVLGIMQRPNRSVEQSLVDALRGRHLLLLFDNCEHLIDAIAALARQILANCPDVKLLATSREALLIDGEQAWPVSPLETEGPASPAFRLFLDRARAVSPGFSSDADAAVIHDVCRRLDGIPLAIELAAARMHAVTPIQLRERLDERFRLLGAAPRRSAEQRHQTLHATVQWSHDLLSARERAVFAHASVFAGGFTLEAAERVCVGDDDVLDVLDSLVRKSLVTAESSGGAMRYGMLETIRAFAAAQCTAQNEDMAVRLRHARYFATDSDTHFAIWLSPLQGDAYRWLDREMGNLRAAFRFARHHGEIDLAARIASNIGDMARFRVRDEAANWAGEILDAARAMQHPRLIVLLTWAASSAWSFGRLGEARRHAEEAITLTGNPAFAPLVWAFTDLAMVETFEGKAEDAITLVRAGAAQPADRLDRFCLAMLPYFLAIAGRDDEAMRAAEENVDAVEAAAVPTSISIAMWARGKAFASAAPAIALAAYERGFELARASGNRFWEMMIIFEIAALQARVGDKVDALRSFSTMLRLGRRSADLMFVSHGLGHLIVLFDRLGHEVAAATLNGTLSKTVEFTPFVPELNDVVARLRQGLGAAPFDAATRRGAGMALHAAYDYAIDEIEKALTASRHICAADTLP